VYSTSVYSYIPRQIVVLNGGTSPRNYNNMYAKTLKLHKGVENRIQFQFINQEQKPVDLTDKTILFRVMSKDGNKLLFTSSVSILLALKGIAELTVPETTLRDYSAQHCYYSLEVKSDANTGVAAYMDNDSGARGDISIVDSVMPKFKAAQVVTVSNSYGILNPNNPTTYYSDTYDSNGSSYSVVQVNYNGFIGTVQLQGSSSSGDWYNIGNPVDVSTDAPNGLMAEGFHPQLRLKLVSGTGSIGRILVR